MQLSECRIGDIYKVREIQLNGNVKRRFEILGMTRGTAVEVLNAKKHGAMIVKIRGTRFAVGQNFAKGIIVEAGDKRE